MLALSVDDLLAGVGLTEDERTAFYAEQTSGIGGNPGDLYRKQKTVLRAAIGDLDAFLSEFPLGDEIGRILAERRSAIRPVGQRLRELRDAGAVSWPLKDLCSSFVHLHLNRLASGEAASEYQILGLLQRTRESLRKAPIRNSTSKEFVLPQDHR